MATPHRTVLLITEKPHQARNVAQAWQLVHPTDRLIHYMTPPMGSFAIKADPHLPLSHIPSISEVVLHETDWSAQMAAHVRDATGDFAQAAAVADLLVCATDPDPQGVRNFYNLCTQLLPHHHLGNILWVAPDTASLDVLIHAIERGRTIWDARFAHLLAIGQARQYVDHNYAANALPLFARCMRAAKAPDPDVFLSKYALQLLMHMHRYTLCPKTEGDLCLLMHHGFGTDPHTPSPLGGPATRHAILTSLRSAGLLEDAQPGAKQAAFHLSPVGHRLAGMIHPSLYDPDLAARIRAWGHDWPRSKPAINHAIRTAFGRQKAHMRALHI